MIGIYKITNILNNKNYIGQSINIEKRWKQHICKGINNSSEGKLYPAMFQDGIENFSFNVIESFENIDKEKLDDREKYWISYYDSFHNGYNSTRGGSGSNMRIYDEDSIKSLWDEGYCITEICNKINCCDGTIRLRLKNYISYSVEINSIREKIFSEKIPVSTNVYIFDPTIIANFQKKTPVYQYDLSGNFIREFASITQAAKFLGNISYSSDIAKASRQLKSHHSAYGYIWRREKINQIKDLPNTKEKKIICLTTNEIFDSIADANRKYPNIDRSGISACCKNKRKSSGKHPVTKEKMVWQYI